MSNLDDLKLPPHSAEAEQSVIGGLLLDNDAIDRIGDLATKDFYNTNHRKIFAEIQRQSSNGKKFDVLTLADELETTGSLEAVGGLPYLGTIVQNVPSAANIRRYSDIVREHAKRRQLIAASSELAELVHSRIPIDEALNKMQAQLLAVTESVQADEPVSIGDIIKQHLDKIERRMVSDRKGITTGLSDLDSILNGGLHCGQLVVLASRPGMGKTALAMHTAIEAAGDGYGVLYLSMEMISAELADRVLASKSRIDLCNILSASGMTEQHWDNITVAVGKLGELPLFVVDKSGLNFYQVASFARRHKRKHGMDLLVIDYLQLMAGDERDRHSQIETITRSLKVLAKELNIAILLLSQLSRKTEEVRRPKLSHLRDSGSIEQDADIVLFIHREETDQPDTQWKNYADIHIAKNRQGALGRIGAIYIGPQVRFENYSGVLPDFSADNSKSRTRFGVKITG